LQISFISIAHASELTECNKNAFSEDEKKPAKQIAKFGAIASG